jgi:para-nitrobenzyl esterase
VSADEGGLSIPTLALAEVHGRSFLEKIGARSIADARKVSAAEIMKAQGPELAVFWPALDGNVLPGDEYVAYEHGDYNNTPALIGTNEDEGAVFVRQAILAGYTAMVRKGYGEKADAILAAFPATNDAQALRAQRDLMSDTAFVWPTYAWAKLQSADGKSSVFEYRWTHRPPNYDRFPMLKDVKASHGSEIDYVFGNGDPSWTDADRKVSDEIESYWINFAKSGDPNGGGRPAWPAYSNAHPSVMKMDVAPEPITLPEMPRLKVLDDYYAWRRAQAQ